MHFPYDIHIQNLHTSGLFMSVIMSQESSHHFHLPFPHPFSVWINCSLPSHKGPLQLSQAVKVSSIAFTSATAAPPTFPLASLLSLIDNNNYSTPSFLTPTLSFDSLKKYELYPDWVRPHAEDTQERRCGFVFLAHSSLSSYQLKPQSPLAIIIAIARSSSLQFFFHFPNLSCLKSISHSFLSYYFSDFKSLSWLFCIRTKLLWLLFKQFHRISIGSWYFLYGKDRQIILFLCSLNSI